MPLSAGCKGPDCRQAPSAVAHLTGFYLGGIEYNKTREFPIGKAVLSTLNSETPAALVQWVAQLLLSALVRVAVGRS